MAYSADELKALAEVLRKHPRVLIATDDMYEAHSMDRRAICEFTDGRP